MGLSEAFATVRDLPLNSIILMVKMIIGKIASPATHFGVICLTVSKV